MSRILIVSLVLAGTLAATFVSTLGPDESEKRLERGRLLMAQGQSLEAAAVLEGVEGNPLELKVAKEAALLRAWALVQGGQPKRGAELARKLFEGFAEDEPGRGRARWVISKAMTVLGRLDEAARLDAALAAKILGDGHRARVAGYYLKLAREASKGQKSNDPLKPSVAPDPRTGARLRKISLSILSDGEPVASITIPRCRDLLEIGSGSQAAKELLRLLKKAKLSAKEDAEARYLRASGLLLAGKVGEAREELQKLLLRPDVEETEFAPKARVLLGESWLRGGAAVEAVAAWRQFLKRFPNRSEVPDVRWRIAETLDDAGDPEEALKAWKALAAEKLATKKQRAQALFLVGESLGSLWRFDEARKAFQSYLAAYPDNRFVPQAQERLMGLLLEKAHWQAKHDQKPQSIKTLEAFITAYPLAQDSAEVAVEIGVRYRELGKHRLAIAALERAKERYRKAQRSQAARAALLAGIIEEEELRDLEKAIASYRLVTREFRRAPAAAQAAERIRRLEQVELELQTPRLYAPGESATVRLTTRNIAKASLRIYAINAPEVFQRRGNLDSAADIEIALVKADRSIAYETPNYQRYRKDRQDVPITLEDGKALGEGSYLVAVETEERRAVVLVIVSKLRVIVKQSPYELFCWVVDAKSGEPRKGVSLQIRGPGVNSTIESGADGVARLTHKKATGRCRVLAVSGASVAPGEALEAPRPSGRGLSPKVAFSFDRPVYRPGSTLRFHATLRSVSQGSFVTPKPQNYLVNLQDPQGRILAERELRSGDFGTLHGEFHIPADARVGSYRVRLRFVKREFSETLEVAAYRKPEYRVSVAMEKNVVRPGDSCKAKIAVEYYFGGPVKNAPLRWNLWRRPLKLDRARFESYAWYLKAIDGNAKKNPSTMAGWKHLSSGVSGTDAQGLGEVSFRTKLLDGNHEYQLQVSVQDSTNQWARGAGRVAAGPSDRFAAVLSQRKAWREGERAEVRVVTRDLLQAPVGTRGRLVAEIARRNAGKISWETLRESTVDTGLRGEAVLSIELPEAGSYRLRFQGKDRLGAPVEAETRVVASGERVDLKKEARLNLESKVYKAGATARMHLNLPFVKRPVLLCFEGERVLSYRILHPKSRFQIHEFEVKEELAPNVKISVAAPFEGRLLTAADELIVLRYLELSLKPEKSVARPGEKLRIDVRSVDQSGRPARAAVVLRAVDAALSALGGRAGRDPRFVFNQERREYLVRTSSSFAFQFDGRTSFVDPDLLKLKNLRRRKSYVAGMARGGGAPGSGGFIGAVEEESAEDDGDSARTGVVQRLRADRAFSKKLRKSGRGGGGGFGAPSRARPSKRSQDSFLLLDGAAPKGSLAFDAPVLSSALPFVKPSIREVFRDVAGWWPEIVTDASGRASVSIELPGNLTTWDLGASGATRSTAVGRASATLRVAQEVMLQVTKPRYLSSGDAVVIPLQLHNNLNEAHSFQLDARSGTPSRLRGVGMSETSLQVGAHDSALRSFRFEAKEAGVARLSVRARSTAASDALDVGVPILAFGIPWEFRRREAMRTRSSFLVTIPDEVIAGSERYIVSVDSGLMGELLDGLDYLARYPYGCLEQSVNRFLPAMVFLDAATKAGRPSVLDAEKLRKQVERGCEALSSFQTAQGNFSYWPGGAAHPWATALALEALSRAQILGYHVNATTLGSALVGAHALLSDARTPVDARASLLLALARMGQADKGAATALYRKRQSLSLAGLCKLGLATQGLGLGDRLDVLSKEIVSRKLPSETPHPKRSRRSWPQSRIEAAALLLQASCILDLPSINRSDLAKTVRALLRQRRGATKGVAAGIEALSIYGLDELATVHSGAIRVLVDGVEVAKGRLDKGRSHLDLVIPAKALAAGRRRISVEKASGESAQLSLLLRHVGRGVQSEGGNQLVKVQRRVIPWQDPNAKASRHKAGYTCVKPEQRPKTEAPPSLSKVAVGTRVSIEVVVTAREELRWLVVEDPQLAGLELIEAGVRGNHDRFERRESAALFFKNHLAKGETMRLVYGAYAVYQGQFSALPARAGEMYAPEVWGHSGSASLEVVADPQMLASVKAPKPTPDELLGDVVEAWNKKNYEELVSVAEPLLKDFVLLDRVQDDLTRKLWLSHLRLGHNRKAVDLEEELRLRNPKMLGLDIIDQDRMGRAWLALGDPEMAMPRFQSVAFHGLQQDLDVAKTYASLGRIGEQAAQLEACFLRYPVDLAASRWMSLADVMLKTPNPRLKQKGRFLPPAHRVLWREAQACYLDLMAWQSGSELAAKAARARLSVWDRLGLKKRRVAEAERYLARFPKDPREDELRWNLAQALFDLDRFDDAAKQAKKLWDWRSPDRRHRRSNRRAQAGYLLGKVAHVNGNTEEAVAWYGKVKDRIKDARQSWLFFTEKKLSVDPVTRSSGSGHARLKLRVKNLRELKAQVYPVDLLVLFAMKKSFDRLAVADLSGIKPAREITQETKLKAYTAGERELDLGELDSGAYLVMVRGADLNAGTLLLVSSAKVTVQRQNGSLRIYLVDGHGKPLAGAKVRIAVGTRIFHSGESDVRGMLSLGDPGPGIITVVATAGDAVAVGTHR